MFWDFCKSIAWFTKQPKLVPDISSKSVPFVLSPGDARTKNQTTKNLFNLTFQFERHRGNVCLHPHGLVQEGLIYWKCLVQA